MPWYEPWVDWGVRMAGVVLGGMAPELTYTVIGPGADIIDG